VDWRGGAMLLQDYRISLHPLAAPGKPVGMTVRPIARARQLPEHLSQKHLQVAVDRQMGPDSRFLEFGGIDVDLHEESVPRKRVPVVADLPDVQTRSQHEQRVCILDGEIAGPLAYGSGSAAEQRIVRGNEIVCPGSGNRDL